MILNHVLTAVDNNPKYTKFIPLFVEQWLRLDPSLTITIVYIGSSIPCSIPHKYHRHIRCFMPISGVHSAYIAQVIRILYPSLLEKNDTIMITDIDMIPGKSSYFQTSIQTQPDNAFVSLRPLSVVSNGQIAMCYVVAKGSTWQSIFQINSERDVESFINAHYNHLYDGNHGGKGWYSDQCILFDFVMKWRGGGGHFIELTDSGSRFSRLDYYRHNYDKQQFATLLNTTPFSDCHLYSHMCEWSDMDINDILKMLT